MLSIITLFACFSLLDGRSIEDFDSGCSVSIEYKSGDLSEPQPLILLRNGTKSSIVYPQNGRNTLNVGSGQTVHLACPGEKNYFRNVGTAREIDATCVGGKIFQVNGRKHDFSSLLCNTAAVHEARRVGSCFNGHRAVEIGFNLKGQFLRTIELCRDERTYNTYYAKFQLSKSIGNLQKGYPRPSTWIAGDFYANVNVFRQYQFDTQMQTLGKLLNSNELASKLLHRTKQFLTRGHMAAKSDFVYGSEQTTTFWYLNAAPQWLTFNAGNWNTLENNVRDVAAKRSLDLVVYTGTHGQMTITDAHGRQQAIHLHVDGSRTTLPVPKYYWKIVYDARNRRGTAFVGLNDPFVKEITKDLYLCEDISSRIKWLTWDRNNIRAGISYACTVEDLRKAVPTIPQFVTTGIFV